MRKNGFLLMRAGVVWLKGRRASIFTKLVVLGLILYASITLMGMYGQIESARESRDALEEVVADLIEENEALEYEIEHRYDPETIERIARNRYQFVMPGERVFYGVIN